MLGLVRILCVFYLGMIYGSSKFGVEISWGHVSFIVLIYLVASFMILIKNGNIVFHKEEE
jgi:hypothetical protein